MSMEILQQTCAFQQHKESKQLVPAAASMSPNHHYLQLEDKLLQQQQIPELGIVHTRHSSVPDSLLLKGSAMNAAENGWSPAHASKGVGVAGDLKHAAMVKLQNNSSSHGNNKIKNVMQAAAKQQQQQQSNGGSNRTTTDEESVDYDSSLENTSVSSFDFNRERAAAAAAAAAANAGQRTSSNGNVSASLHHKPAVPSKWDDAEKWLISADAAALRGNKPKMQQLLSTIPSHVIINASKKAALLGQQQQQAVRSNNKQLTGGGDQSSDETTVTTKKIDTAGGPYKFSFMPSPAAVLLNNPHSKTRSMSSLDRYPLEELLTCDHQKLTLVSLSDDHDTADDDTMSKPALRTEKPTSDFPTNDISAAAANSKVSNSGVAVEGAVSSRDMDEQNSYVTTPPPLLHHHHHHHHHSGGGGGGGGGGLRSVSMRDMGTEMTPIASQEPSRTGTPLRATTPTIRSPVSSRPSTPGRLPAATATAATAATATNVSSDEATTTTTTTGTVVDGELSEKQLQAKTRQEILALGTQLGKANIAAWASREEEEEDASKCLKNIDLDEVKRNVVEARACAWEEQEKAKYEARYKREESKIIAWENHEKAKAEAEMRRIEVKVERMRSHSHEQLMNKLAVSHRRAEDLRAAAEARRVEQAAKTAQRAEYIRETGNMPPANSSSFSQLFQQLGRLCC